MNFLTGVSGVPGQGDGGFSHALSRFTPNVRTPCDPPLCNRGAGVSARAIRDP